MFREDLDEYEHQPMSTDIPSGRELVAAANGTGFKVLVGHHRRFNPYIVAAKQQLVDGKLGKGKILLQTASSPSLSLVLAVQGEWIVLKAQPPGVFRTTNQLERREQERRCYPH